MRVPKGVCIYFTLSPSIVRIIKLIVRCGIKVTVKFTLAYENYHKIRRSYGINGRLKRTHRRTVKIYRCNLTCRSRGVAVVKLLRETQCARDDTVTQHATGGHTRQPRQNIYV